MMPSGRLAGGVEQRRGQVWGRGPNPVQCGSSIGRFATVFLHSSGESLAGETVSSTSIARDCASLGDPQRRLIGICFSSTEFWSTCANGNRGSERARRKALVDEEADEVAEPPPNRLSRARHHSWIFTIPFEDAHRYPRLLQLEFPLHLVQEILHSSLVLDSCISIYKVLTHFGALVGYKSNTLFLTVTTALNKVSFFTNHTRILQLETGEVYSLREPSRLLKMPMPSLVHLYPLSLQAAVLHLFQQHWIENS